MAQGKEKNKKGIIATIIGAVVAVVVIMLIFVFPNNKEQVVTMQTEVDGVTIKMTYYAKGDRVYKQTSENIIPYSSLGVETEVEARAKMSDLLSPTENIEGYSDTIEYKDDHMLETLVIDYDTVDIDKVKDLAGNYFSGDASDNVSLSKSIEWLEESGFKRVDN